MVDITVLKRFEASLRESEERHRLLAESLRRLTHHVQTVREEERARIARELHDELGQSLTALKLDLHWLQGRIGDGTPEGRIRIESMCSLVEDTLQAIKGICADLRPAILDDFGLIAAIEWQAKQFESLTGIRCRTSIHPAKARIPGAQATAVFRILQESLTNIARHARASAAEISLNVSAESLLLKVADNGIGIGEKRLEGLHSLGLAGMRERALGWGGTIAVATGARRGTTVTLKMRIGRETSDEDGDGMMELPEARRSLRPGSLCTDKPKGRQGRVHPDSRRVERIASGRTRQAQHQ
jgi:signal transduction histidine kinase